MLLIGCDFSSAPTRRKTIVVATGALAPDSKSVRLHELHRFATLDAWSEWLAAQPAWIGGFDFPFSLPRELVEHLGWPTDWPELIAHYAALERSEIRRLFAAFCAARPVGGKFAHRGSDGPAGASPSMKWVNPPVAYMLHAGVPRLMAAGACFPGLHMGPASERVALEAYPGLLARELVGRASYKSDDRARQNEARRAARAELLARLGRGNSRLGLSVDLAPAHETLLIDDATGDALDALLCLVQAAWAAREGAPRFGLPEGTDPLEGWIVSA
ncbi:DUF429 domain-containing protein [Variovorax sp. OV329]|uniref:DUF429 domain-containing protein n=1 Tax=Variovorax sp. OV329 TaxID=1882825 RepID=UPI0008F355FA|nr:DUF429 domain-containing protein [Variovorax sp. OV329]SFM06935.1 Protein of unknown function [Variovorax sp. OV329]